MDIVIKLTLYGLISEYKYTNTQNNSWIIILKMFISTYFIQYKAEPPRESLSNQTMVTQVFNQRSRMHNADIHIIKTLQHTQHDPHEKIQKLNFS